MVLEKATAVFEEISVTAKAMLEKVIVRAEKKTVGAVLVLVLEEATATFEEMSVPEKTVVLNAQDFVERSTFGDIWNLIRRHILL